MRAFLYWLARGCPATSTPLGLKGSFGAHTLRKTHTSNTVYGVGGTSR